MLQARYGWHDEYILGLEYSNWVKKRKIVSERVEENKRMEAIRTYTIAFLGWNFGIAGDKMSWPDYLKKTELMDVRSAARNEKKTTPEEATAKAESIKAMLKDGFEQ